MEWNEFVIEAPLIIIVNRNSTIKLKKLKEYQCSTNHNAFQFDSHIIYLCLSFFNAPTLEASVDEICLHEAGDWATATFID